MVIDISKLTDKHPINFNFSNLINLKANLNLQYHNINFKIYGTITKEAGAYSCIATASSILPFLCDFCLSPLEHHINSSVNEKFKKPESFPSANNEDIIWLSHNKINIRPALIANLYKHIPLQALCKNDCKGLCIKCGTNLNNTTCNCNQYKNNNNINPKFEILKKIKFD